MSLSLSSKSFVTVNIARYSLSFVTIGAVNSGFATFSLSSVISAGSITQEKVKFNPSGSEEALPSKLPVSPSGISKSAPAFATGGRSACFTVTTTVSAFEYFSPSFTVRATRY